MFSFQYCLDNGFGLFKNDPVFKAQGLNTISILHELITFVVVGVHQALVMIIAIKLYSKLYLNTIKIKYIVFYTVLPAELKPTYLPALEDGPQCCLGRSRGTT